MRVLGREESELSKLCSLSKSFLEKQNGMGGGDFLNCCFLGAQGSDKVQYCHCHKIEEKKKE